MKMIIGLLWCMVFCSTAVANLYGSDDFNDNVRDPAKWSVGIGDSLTETNSRLEYSGGSGEVAGAWGWELNSGSYVQDWSMSIDVVNSVDATALTNREVEFGFLALTKNDYSFSTQLVVGDDAGGSNPYRHIGTDAENDTGNVLAHERATTATSLQLQISFDASAKVFTSSYDSGGGLTVLTNYNVSSWGMSDSDVFTIAVFGISSDVTPLSGEVHGDNFAAIPEPSTLALLGVALGGMLLARRRDRRNGIPECSRHDHECKKGAPHEP